MIIMEEVQEDLRKTINESFRYVAVEVAHVTEEHQVHAIQLVISLRILILACLTHLFKLVVQSHTISQPLQNQKVNQ